MISSEDSRNKRLSVYDKQYLYDHGRKISPKNVYDDRIVKIKLGFYERFLWTAFRNDHCCLLLVLSPEPIFMVRHQVVGHVVTK